MDKPPMIPPIIQSPPPQTPVSPYNNHQSSPKKPSKLVLPLLLILASLPILLLAMIAIPNFIKGYQQGKAMSLAGTARHDALQINDQAFVMNMINLPPEETYKRMTPKDVTAETHAQNTVWLRQTLKATTPKIEYLSTSSCYLGDTQALRSTYKIYGHPRVCFITIFHPTNSEKYDSPISYRLRG